MGTIAAQRRYLDPCLEGDHFDGKTAFCYTQHDMARKKTTVYIEEDLLKAAKIAAARTGKRGYQVFEEALRQYLGAGVIEKVWRRSRLSEDQALRLAYKELHTARR